MLARPTLTKRPDATIAEKPKGQARPVEEQFLLRVIGQIRRSFSSKGPAIPAGGVIKKAFPLIMVTIVDTEDGSVEVINA